MTVTIAGVGAGRALSNVNSISWTEAIANTDANTVVLTGVASGNTSGLHSSWTRGCTLNGVAMTSLAAKNSGSDASANGGFEWFYLFNPPAGTVTLVASTTIGGGTITSMIGQSLCYSGVASLGTPVSNNNLSGAPSVSVSSAVGNIVLFGHASGAAIATPTQTQQFLNNLNGSTAAGNMLIQDAAGATTVVGGAASNADHWANIGVSLVAAVGGSPAPTGMALFF